MQNKIHVCQCGNKSFIDCSYKATDKLPYVQGIMCIKCGRTYFNKEQSLAYQKAKRKQINKRKDK